MGQDFSDPEALRAWIKENQYQFWYEVDHRISSPKPQCASRDRATAFAGCHLAQLLLNKGIGLLYIQKDEWLRGRCFRHPASGNL
ncbi:hypothetical protein DFAR_3900004 [Desulfarculales bacterium]